MGNKCVFWACFLNFVKLLRYKAVMLFFQDFSKSQHMRHFVQDYIRALYSQNAGEAVIQKFVSR